MSEQLKKAGGLLARLGIAWAWFSQITSIIGLIGMAEDLRLWLEASAWLLEVLRTAAPGVADFLASMGASVHQGLEFFRGLYRPVFEFAFGWLPFEVPVIVFDIALVAIFVLASRWRVSAAYLKQWVKVGRSEDAEWLASAARMGIVCGQREAHRLQNAVRGFQQARHFGVEEPEYAVEDLAWARANFGAAFEPFALARPLFLDIGDTKRRLLGGQRWIMRFIYGFAGIVALMLAAELVWFR